MKVNEDGKTLTTVDANTSKKTGDPNGSAITTGGQIRLHTNKPFEKLLAHSTGFFRAQDLA